ncbi:MAG: hypothetical protein ACTHKP_16060 [Nitrososphaeraceae archaeon]
MKVISRIYKSQKNNNIRRTTITPPPSSEDNKPLKRNLPNGDDLLAGPATEHTK